VNEEDTMYEAAEAGEQPTSAGRTAMERGTVEQAIMAAFAAVLQVPPDTLDRDSDFFEVGGDSVLAGRTIARLQQDVTIRIRMRDLFSAPTPGTLAAAILDRAGGTNRP
jgi:acyl carrier protein